MWSIISVILQLGSLLLSRYFKYKDKKEKVEHREKIKGFKNALKDGDSDTVNNMLNDLMRKR